MRNNKNRVAFIVVLSLILLVLTVGSKNTHNSSYTAEPTAIPTPQYTPLSQPSVDTSTWKTYTDPVLKYDIKYPSTVIIDPRGKISGQSVVFLFPDDQNYPGDGGGEIARLNIDLVISKSKDPNEAYKENIVSGGDSRREFPFIRINNAYGIDTALYIPGGIETNLQYYVNDAKESGNIIYLNLSGYSHNDPKKIESLKQILRTFRFVR